MAFATIQITQGASVGGNGESVIGLDTSTLITMTDAGGAGATTYLWEVVSFPAPDASAPTIGSSTAQIATITPPGSGLTDGLYLLRLTRDDPGDGISTDVKFFAVGDDDGLSLPSSGQNRNNSNVGGSAAAQEAGWYGSTVGGTNIFLDAFLRLRRLREGRYLGKVGQVSFTAANPATETYTWGTHDPLQEITFNSSFSADYTVDLDVAGAQEGATFRFQLTYFAGSGDFTIIDGGGPALLTLSPPPAGSIKYSIDTYFDGADWKLRGVRVQDEEFTRNIQNQKEFPALVGVQSTSEDTFQRAGTVRVDPSLLPSSQQISFVASFDTTTAGNAAEVRLYNVTDDVIVGTAFTTTSTVSQTQSATITLPSSLKDYEVQVRLTTTDPTERAVVTRAAIVAVWG